MSKIRIHILSDLHLEMRRHNWRHFVSCIPSNVGDVLVLAGDVVNFSVPETPEMLAELRKKAWKVVYVLGNHEHYDGVYEETKKLALEMCERVDIFLLDTSYAVLSPNPGVARRFIGGTLWFPEPQSPEVQRSRFSMSDFHVIHKFEENVYQDNARDVAFLRNEILPGDVVVTHHLPARGSIAPQYQRGAASILNPFFLCDCVDMILERKPALWIHGHTHTACDYLLGSTRIVCNPIGYPGELTGSQDRLGFFVDV